MLSKCLHLTLISDCCDLILEGWGGGGYCVSPTCSVICSHYVMGVYQSVVVKLCIITGFEVMSGTISALSSASTILAAEYQVSNTGIFSSHGVRTGHVRTSATIIRQNIFNQDSTCLPIPPWSLYHRFYSRFLLFQSCRQ